MTDHTETKTETLTRYLSQINAVTELLLMRESTDPVLFDSLLLISDRIKDVENVIHK